MKPKDLLTLLSTAAVWPFLTADQRRTVNGLRAMIYLSWALNADGDLTTEAVLKSVVSSALAVASTTPNADLNA